MPLPVFFLGIALQLSAAHPLDALGAEEIQLCNRIIKSANQFGSDVEIASMWLDEPSKEELRTAQPPRRAFSIVYNRKKHETYTALIDIRGQQLLSSKREPRAQPWLMGEDYRLAERIVRADKQWQAAITKRGLKNDASVYVGFWAPGVVEDFASEQRRLVKTEFFSLNGTSNLYAKPIEGLIATVDLVEQKIVKIEDSGQTLLPPDAATLPIRRASLTNSTFENTLKVERSLVQWSNWQFRINFHPREGLVIHEAGWATGNKFRKILHRASLSEMLVPYAGKDFAWNWKNAFDAGEYGMGITSSPLVRGEDTPQGSVLLNPVIPVEGRPAVKSAAIGIYERDGGVMWRHDGKTGRRARELVVTSAATIGNYDYLIQYVFCQDGSIKFEVLLTGLIIAKAVHATTGHKPGSTGTYLARNLEGVNHQHFFSFRIDPDVESPFNNSVYECDTKELPSEKGNAFGMEETLIASEALGRRFLNLDATRHWRITNPSVLNRWGSPVGYMLMPGENTRPYSKPENLARQRAGFIENPFWVSRYRADEMFAAGLFPNQISTREGLPTFLTNDEPLANEDVVIWYTLGVHHLPRPEDWPIMPVHKASFSLVPVGFFDQNPTLDRGGS